MQNCSFLSDFFMNNISDANEKEFNCMNFFAKCLSKYYYNIYSFSCNMLYKNSKFEIFSNFNSISISYSF